jgi:hypothetical protein
MRDQYEACTKSPQCAPPVLQLLLLLLLLLMLLLLGQLLQLLTPNTSPAI